MAYDPEAREQSNSAMIIAVVALVIVALGALAWFATKPAESPVVVTPTTVEKHTETVTEVPVPANNTPNTVVVQPGSPAPAPSTKTETQVTINPPAGNAAPPATTNPAPAGDAATPPADSAPAPQGY